MQPQKTIQLPQDRRTLLIQRRVAVSPAVAAVMASHAFGRDLSSIHSINPAAAQQGAR